MSVSKSPTIFRSLHSGPLNRCLYFRRRKETLFCRNGEFSIAAADDNSSSYWSSPPPPPSSCSLRKNQRDLGLPPVPPPMATENVDDVVVDEGISAEGHEGRSSSKMDAILRNLINLTFQSREKGADAC
uniref:Uncharacterized protein n=1 Tax=Romanomermis culicivorax TaxID=13658 RepID=A0A915J7Y7_ROMCU